MIYSTVLNQLKKWIAARHTYENLKNRWSRLKSCPEALYDSGSVYLNGKLYVYGGFNSQQKVINKIFIYDCENDFWETILDVPLGFPQSHCAVCTDEERYIYLAGGQLGPECAPAIANVFAFDTKEHKWFNLPDLPYPRYAGTMQYINGYLHYVGGAKENRHTPSASHWKLMVNGRKSDNKTWTELAPCPLAAMHRGSIKLKGNLYVFGGQRGDFQPRKKSNRSLCTGATQEIYCDGVYKYSQELNTWITLPSMLIPASHIDFSVLHHDNYVYVLGGQLFKHPYKYWIRLGNQIQRFDLKSETWDIAEGLPFRVKLVSSCLHNGKIIFTCGQRDVSKQIDLTGLISKKTFSCSLDEFKKVPGHDEKLPYLGKQFLLVTHEISLTGAPLILLELALFLRKNGGIVRTLSLANDVTPENVFLENHFAVLAKDYAHEYAVKSDVIITNTAVCGPWIRHILMINPNIANKLLWWIHENDPDLYGHFFLDNNQVKNVVFDSENQKNTWIPAYLPEKISAEIVYPRIRTSFEKENKPDKKLLKRKFGLDSNDLVLLTIGAFGEIKGQDLLLKSAARIADCKQLKMVIVGFQHDKQLRKYYNSLCKREKELVNHGKLLFTTQKDLIEFYSIADVFVINTQFYGEPFGLVTIEAMLSELPVLATQAGGSIEIVEEELSGLFHPVGEVGIPILQKNILRLMNNPSERKLMGQRGRAIVLEKFNNDLFNFKFFKILDEIIS